MGRLRSLAPRIGELSSGPRKLDISFDDARRGLEWRKWYGLARWKAKPNGARWRCLVRDLFTCQMCGVIEADSSQLVADHKIPHRGDAALFWDDDNLQCLCKPCHDADKQRAEVGQRGGGVESLQSAPHGNRRS